MKKKLFEKINGFDKRADPLDDWVLKEKLKKENIKPKTAPISVFVDEPINIIKIVKRRFKKGQYLKSFQKLYPSASQTKIRKRVKFYFKNINKITIEFADNTFSTRDEITIHLG